MVGGMGGPAGRDVRSEGVEKGVDIYPGMRNVPPDDLTTLFDSAHHCSGRQRCSFTVGARGRWLVGGAVVSPYSR